MPRLHSFITLLWLSVRSLAMPLADDNDNDDDDGDECGPDVPQSVQLVVSTSPAVHVPNAPSAAILAPYERPPTPHPHPQYPHATLPVSHRSQIPTMLGAIIAILIALIAFSLTARYVARRRRFAADPFKDPAKPRFAPFWFRRSIASKKRLSDESWVSPALPGLRSPGSPLSEDFGLRRYTFPQRKLVPVTTPVCTPIDTEFGARLEFANGDPSTVIPVPPVRVPSPVYISPFSPSPSISSSSSLSPVPSTEPLSSPSLNPARLSRLLSSNFRDTRVVASPARPTTAHLIQTARSYAHAYRPSSATTTSLYIPPTPSARFAGTRSRTGFYPHDACAAWGGVRDTFSTVTTSDTDTVCTVPHLLSAAAEVQPFASPFADPDHRGAGNDNAPASDQSTGMEDQTQTLVGTPLGLKVRLSDASEHARYRLRERQREGERQQRRERERERAEQRVSTDSQTSTSTATSMDTARTVRQRSWSLEGDEVRREFRLRDSGSVLREIGW